MSSRREFLQIGLATSAILGAGWSTRGLAQPVSEDALIEMPAVGNVTLIHVTDIHAQLVPIWHREPSINLGVGEVSGVPPHVTGADFLRLYGIDPGSLGAYTLTSEDYTALARDFGRVGGLDRVATVVERIRAERPNALLFDGGDTWQGSLTALRTRGQDMVSAMALLRPDAMTAHWEFTLGVDRVDEILEDLAFPLLGANIFDADWNEPAYQAYQMFERGGVRIATIGQAFPYLPIANPGWMFPNLSFGIREERVRETVDEVRAAGADLVVLLSHNGFDVDRKLASRVPGIDVILCGHTHDALPEATQVGSTLLIASGSNGKFVSRLDLDVRDGQVRDFGYRLIPVLSDAIAPDPTMRSLIEEIRAPYRGELEEVIGTTDSLLYRRGNFNGTLDDLICRSLLEVRDAEIALSPGFRWGPTLLPGDPIRREDIYDATAITYPNAYRTEMTGAQLHAIMEDVADNLFNVDPYYQQGGDMVRVGGLGYAIDVSRPMGERISDMTLLSSGDPIDPARTYTVAGWASVNEDTEGPPIWDVVEEYVRDAGTVSFDPTDAVEIRGT